MNSDHARGSWESRNVAWHISSFSSEGSGNCVEAGPLRDGSERVAVRHSRRPDAEVIVYTRSEWEAFLRGVRAGEFDFFAPAEESGVDQSSHRSFGLEE